MVIITARFHITDQLPCLSLEEALTERTIRDPYPVVTSEQMAWFMKLLEGIVPDPSCIVSVDRIRGTNDLEFKINLTEAGRHVFERKGLCEALRTIVGAALGHPAPALRFYVNEEPLPATWQSLVEESHL